VGFEDVTLLVTSGSPIARVGEVIHGGGGYYDGVLGRSHVEELSGESIPERCIPDGPIADRFRDHLRGRARFVRIGGDVRRRSVTGVTRPCAGLELCRGPFPMGVGRSPPCRWSRDRGHDDSKHHELPVVSRRPMSVHHRLPTRRAAACRRGVDPGGCGRLVRDAAKPSFVDGLWGLGCRLRNSDRVTRPGSRMSLPSRSDCRPCPVGGVMPSSADHPNKTVPLGVHGEWWCSRLGL
jgi:hypothetical protein